MEQKGVAYNKKSYDYLIKGLLIGGVETGKTQLIHAEVDHGFGPGIDFSKGMQWLPKTYSAGQVRDDIIVKAQWWEAFSDNPSYEGLNISLYRSSMVVLGVYDITSKASFQNLISIIHDIKKHTHGLPMILVGNKCDLQNQRVVQTAEGEALAAKYKMLFFETSATTGHNVKAVFIAAARLALNKLIPEDKAQESAAMMQQPNNALAVNLLSASSSSSTSNPYLNLSLQNPRHVAGGSSDDEQAESKEEPTVKAFKYAELAVAGNPQPEGQVGPVRKETGVRLQVDIRLVNDGGDVCTQKQFSSVEQAQTFLAAFKYQNDLIAAEEQPGAPGSSQLEEEPASVYPGYESIHR